jgi:hypothetical protein
MHNNISKDIVLKRKAFKLMEDASKRGYHATHSIIFNKRKIKTLIIEISENKPCELMPIKNSAKERMLKNNQKVLDIIKNNPGIQPKDILIKLKNKMSVRNLCKILKSFRDKELVLVASAGKSKSDPTRQYYLSSL